MGAEELWLSLELALEVDGPFQDDHEIPRLSPGLFTSTSM